jgi:3-isopropylmalate dehydrogenase
MLLRYSLNLEVEAHAVERAVYATLDAGIVTKDVAALRRNDIYTDVVGAAIVDRIQVA